MPTKTISLIALLFSIGLFGCGKGKPKGPSFMTTEELRNYVSTPVDWVNVKLTDRGVELNAARQKLTAFVQPESYRVCTSIEVYFHALVPNSKIHPGEQDIHIIAAFNSAGNVQNLDVSTHATALMDLNEGLPLRLDRQQPSRTQAHHIVPEMTKRTPGSALRISWRSE
jgi:hypothetical protein